MNSFDRHTAMENAEMNAGAGSRPATTPALNFDVVRSVKQHTRLAVMVGIAVFLLVALYAITRKPIYKAESLVYVEPLTTRVVSDGSGGMYDPARYDSYIQQQIQTAQREDILEAAIAKMPAGTWQRQDESAADAAARLATALKVQRVGSSYQLSISMQAYSGEQAAAVVNAVTQAYLEKGRQDENARSDGRLALLKEESQRIQAELTQDRAEQAQLSKTLGVADSASPSANPYDAQLAGVRTELTAAREAHDIAEAQLATVTAGSAQNAVGLKAVADEVVAADPGMMALKASVYQRRAQLSSQMAGLTPANPLYKQDQDELTQLDQQIEAKASALRKQAAQRVEDKLRLDLRRTGDVEARLNGQLAQDVAMASSAAPKLQRASELTADITRLESRYTTVDDALRGLELESNGPGTAHLSVAASVPEVPEASKKNLLLALSLPLGLLAGIAAAVFARKRDVRVYTVGDVELELGVAPMCVVPMAHEVSDSVMEEYLLRLAAALERAYRMNGARSFVFTAASESTDIASFVDAVREQLAALGFAVTALHAANVMRGDEDDRYVRDQWRQGVEGEIAGSRFSRGAYGRNDGVAVAKLEALKQDNDLVLVAAAPLLHSAASEYTASAVDATFVMIESGVTTRSELKHCMVLLRRLKARGVGTVLKDLASKDCETEFRSAIAVVERRVAPRVQLQPVDEVMAAEEVRPLRRFDDGDAQKTKPRQQGKERREFVEANVREVAYVAPAEEPYFEAVPALHDEEPRFEEIFAVPRIVEVAPQAAPVKTFVEEPVSVPAAVAPVMAEHEIVAPLVVAAEPIAVSAPVVIDETEADRVRKAVIARVKAKFTPKPPPVVVPEVVVPEVLAEEAVAAPAFEETVVAEAAPAVVEPDVKPARMLLWGASIRSSKKKEKKAEVAAKAVAVPAAVPVPVVTKTAKVIAAPVAAPPAAVVLPVVKVEAPVSAPKKVWAEVKPETVAAVPVVGVPKAAVHQANDLRVKDEELAQRLRSHRMESSGSIPVFELAKRPERRSRARMAAFPQGLTKAVHAMGRAEDRPHAFYEGPRLTPQEQAIVRLTESGKHTVANGTFGAEAPRQTAGPRRWGLLSQFDLRDSASGEALHAMEQDRAVV